MHTATATVNAGMTDARGKMLGYRIVVDKLPASHPTAPDTYFHRLVYLKNGRPQATPMQCGYDHGFLTVEEALESGQNAAHFMIENVLRATYFVKFL